MSERLQRDHELPSDPKALAQMLVRTVEYAANGGRAFMFRDYFDVATGEATPAMEVIEWAIAEIQKNARRADRSEGSPP